MRICMFETMNLSVPMIDIAGTLYTSSAVLAETFGIALPTVRSVVKRNKERFSGATIGDALLSVADCDANGWKETLRIERLRKDTVLWSHRDLIHLGLLLTGETARAFQEDVIDLIEQHALPFDMHEIPLMICRVRGLIGQMERVGRQIAIGLLG